PWRNRSCRPRRTRLCSLRARPRYPCHSRSCEKAAAFGNAPRCSPGSYRVLCPPNARARTRRKTVRANAGPVFKGVCKNFSRSKGHGYIRPVHGGEDIFVHISDIEGEYVPVEGDEVTYKVCPVPPKNVKVQAVEVIITHLKPGSKHETWSGQIISS
uniref:CSD domain-containing protein n=1 Tax=Cyprinus carpio carpio TaxID=630221 RepID=A0A9J7Z2U2_CYPCA